MENKKMTKKETIDLLIDVLLGNKEVEDVQIFIDFLTHERELLERKSSNSGQTKTQKENEILKEKILNTLEILGRYATIDEIQSANVELAIYKNQKMSALLTQLVNAKKVDRQVDKKRAYFKLVWQLIVNYLTLQYVK